MFEASRTKGFAYSLLIFAVSSLLAASIPAGAQVFRAVPVVIYGDGNPENGVEDNREPVVEQLTEKPGKRDSSLNAGSIHCDGNFRGTAMVVDTRESAADIDGVVLLSAAHVIYNLQKNRRFRRCRFHFMGQRRFTGYDSRIDMKTMRLGNFDPQQATNGLAFGEGDWAFLYVPRPWKKYRPYQSVRLREFAFSSTPSFQQARGEFSLVAFDRRAGAIRRSVNCTVIESRAGDIGGGAWKGQILDDCDSLDGSSGGGIIASLNESQFLIGIRTGSHWSEQLFPADSFPNGPPAGSNWNPLSNTNFGRAIDANLLHVFDAFIQTLRD